MKFLLLQSLCLATRATSLYTREAHYRPKVHLKGVTHYTLQSKACEKEYEQIVRTPFVVGRGFISRRFVILSVYFRRQQATALRYFRQVKPALRKAPLRRGFLLYIFTFMKFYGIIILVRCLIDKLEFCEVIVMVDITTWMNVFLKSLNELFANRVWFVGLQGSYGRGEATETSDIDVVVILDELSAKDIQAYNNMLDTLPHRELICGFVSGKKEILNWEPSDLFQFYYDTTPIKGSLDELLSVIDESAVDRAIQIGVCNVYHGCVHNMLHEKNKDILKGLYKSASFVVQAIAFKQTGNYIKNLKDLLGVVSSDEQAIVETFLNLKNGGMIDFDLMSSILFDWTKKWITKDN